MDAGRAPFPQAPPLLRKLEGAALALRGLARHNVLMDRRLTDPAFVQYWMQAVARGNFGELERMSEGGTWPDIKPSTPNTSALLLACMNGYTKIVARLLQDGADANFKNDAFYTALLANCEEGNATITRMLLGAKADPTYCGPDGLTPLILAARNGHTQIARVLLRRAKVKKTINRHAQEGSFALLEAVASHSPQLVKLLLQSGAHPNLRDSVSHERALDRAISENDNDSARFLIEGGAKLNCVRAANDVLPLVRAIHQGRRQIVDLLLEGGADPHKSGRDGMSSMRAMPGSGMPSLGEILAEREGKQIEQGTIKTRAAANPTRL